MRILKAALNFLFPAFCPACGDYLGFWSDPRRICASCFSALRSQARDYAHWMKSPEGLDGLWSLAPYGSEPLTRLIHKMKYQSKGWIVESLRPALEEFLPSSGLNHMADLAVPVPLYPARSRQRGFNQAHLIAREAAGVLGIELKEALIKVKATAPQARIEGPAKRAQNISGSFQSQNVQGRKLLLVDDVYTSGATLAECARALREAGASKVFGCTLARA